MRPPPGTSPGPDFVPRAQCWRCRKARAVCVCALVPRVENRTAVIVIQHKHERHHALGTVRLLKLSLARVRVEVALQESVPPLPVPPGTGLLFPGPEARPLDSLAAHERPAALLGLDGTWPETRRMFNKSPWIQGLPRYSLRPRAPSRYRLRLEPSPHHISTLEAVVQALQCLEPETPGLLELVRAFDEMIEAQVRYIPPALRPPPPPPLEAATDL